LLLDETKNEVTVAGKPEVETDGLGGYNDPAWRRGKRLCGNATMLRESLVVVSIR
jgi:hypothetical protein